MRQNNTRCINSFPASGDFCHLLITFENSLDPDQEQHSVAADLDPNDLTHRVSEIFF